MADLRIAILANTEDTHVPTLAAGMHRMLGRIGVQSKVFHTALRWLIPHNDLYTYTGERPAVRRLKTLAKGGVAFPYLARLAPFDAIVVVMNTPHAFMRYLKVEWIRRFFPAKPVVLYDLHYLPTMGKWARVLREGDPQLGIARGKQFGLERYDWYLMVSVVSEHPLVAGLAHPYSLVGMDLDDGTLYPEQGSDFVALLDFARPDFAAERAVQLRALEEAGIRHVTLEGHYPIREIRRIYRRCSLYFPATHESFGLPISETQACGAHVMTPYARWCPAHQVHKDPYCAGVGSLPPNFVVYDNDKDRLVAEIRRLRSSYDAQGVVESFREQQPTFWHGDPEALRQWVHMLLTERITSLSHKAYGDWPVIDVWSGQGQ